MDKVGINPVVAQYVPNKKAFIPEETMPNDYTEKTYDIPQQAAETMKANVLYKPSEPDSEYKEYIPQDATPKEVRDILADKKEVGRSFWGFKRTIRKGIENSKNPEQAIDNLNFLLNANNKKLPAATISQVLAITENVNNESKWSGAHCKKHYGFEGGKLTKESLDKILKVKEQDDMLAFMVMATQPVYTAPMPAPMPIYTPMTPIPVPGMPMGSVMI